MLDFEVVATVIVAFFIIGIGVGVVVVIAMSTVRLHRRREAWQSQWPPPPHRTGWPGERGGWPGGGGQPGEDEAGREEPPGPDSGNGPPRWPGG